MKIRIKGNSIRYRLTKTDVINFGKEGAIEEKTEFPGSPPLFYCLQKKANITGLEAAFSGNRICIFVPDKMASEWVTTDVVGFENKVDIGEGKTLLLLIEKDFVCLDPALEDQTDNYPNPNKTC